MRCPKCDSPQPHLHPAVQCDGEVHVCSDDFHRTITPSNTPEKIRSNGLEPMPAPESGVGWEQPSLNTADGSDDWELEP